MTTSADKFDSERWRRYRAQIMAQGMHAAHNNTQHITALEHDIRANIECQHTHHTVPCSGTVTHRLTRKCSTPGVICSSAAGYLQRQINAGGYGCDGCGHVLSYCWKVEKWG